MVVVEVVVEDLEAAGTVDSEAGDTVSAAAAVVVEDSVALADSVAGFGAAAAAEEEEEGLLDWEDTLR